MMSLHPFLTAFLALFLTDPSLSHMLMNTPTPFSPDKAMTWPLDPPGGQYPYPCQGWTDVAHRTVVTAGSTTLVNFTGSAPHGGGSCQSGINYNGLPAYSTEPEDWRTIYTIIGGCPAETASNLEHEPFFRGFGARQIPDAVHCGDDKGKDCIRQFEIPIPRGLPNGDATFAWMWYNKITRDEVYMMCAPITVTGGTDDQEAGQRFVEELPVMFLANIKGFTECTTSTTGVHGVFNIPNPGRYGVQLIEPDPEAAGDCPVAPPANFEADDGVEEGVPVAPSPSPSPVHGPKPSPTPGRGRGRNRDPPFRANTEGQEAPPPTKSYPCTEEGSVVCMKEDHFGVCIAGVAYPTPLATVLVCRDGKIEPVG